MTSISLEPWQIQPDADTPGLYLACSSIEQRSTIVRAINTFEALLTALKAIHDPFDGATIAELESFDEIVPPMKAIIKARAAIAAAEGDA